MKTNSRKSIDWDKWGIKEINSVLPERGKCRTCKHHELWHLDQKPHCNYNFHHEVKPSRPSTIDILVPKESKSSICQCFEYIPGDNLAYLEWCHNKNVSQ